MTIGLRGIVEIRDAYDVLLEPEEGVDPRQIIGDALGSTFDGVTLPNRGLFHPELSGHTCRTLGLQPDGGPTKWTLFATYSNSQSNNPTTDPTLEPPGISYGGVREVVEIDADLDGKPIATTAGEPFEQGLLVDRADIALSYSVNVPATQVNLAWLLTYANKTNSDTWNGALPGEALIDGPINARYVYGTDQLPDYYEIAFQVLVRKNSTQAGAPPANAWRRRVLNQGMRYKSFGKLKLATDDDGLPLNRPILLDALGGKATEPHFLWFRVYDAVPFEPLAVVLP